MFMRFITDLKKYNGYALKSASAELKAEVANSYLNWLWWIINPLCFMFIYSFIYGHVFMAKEEYFLAFIFVGITLWDFFSRMINVSIKIVKNNKHIVSKVYLPKYILLIQKMYVNAFKMLISIIIILFMLIYYRVPVSPNIIYIIPLFLILILFTFGISSMLLHFGVFIEDLTNVVSIFLKFLFYFTGVFYDVAKRMPKPLGELIVRYNPVAFVIDGIRQSVLYGKQLNVKLILFWMLVSCLLCAIGIVTICRNENSYVKII